MHPSDHIMLLRTADGDEAAARWLWQTWGRRIRAYALVLGGSADLADDVAQEVFLTVLSLKRREIQAVRDVGPWMLRLARNELYNTVRGEGRLRRRQRAVGEDQARADLTRAASSPPVALGEMAGWVMQLSDEHREVIVLKHVAGLTFDQIADALDEPRSTAASRYQVALASLRRLISGEQNNERKTTENTPHLKLHPAPTNDPPHSPAQLNQQPPTAPLNQPITRAARVGAWVRGRSNHGS